jgi:serine/threonine protein kinase/tetratricopeptide (TPR) repeat protein
MPQVDDSFLADGGASTIVSGQILASRYEVLERLGEGGMGTVYRVRDRELDRIVALKTIRADLASNPSTIRRFKQELLLARQISHRNVIRIYDLGVSGGLRFITMEYVEGQDLRSLMRARGKFSPEDAVEIVQQLCAGLEAAHAEQVIHRDLKPQNILIDTHGHVRIMDFGLARTLEQSGITRSGMIVGTADYMSPEQARGDEIDSRSDLFSLGLIFYEMLTGILPLTGESIVTTLLRRTRETAEPIQSVNPSVPSWLARIVMRCLEPLPENRYQSAAEIARDLGRSVEPGPPANLNPNALAPGALLGTRYKIEARAGEGGMGVVYRAADLHLGRSVALKVIRPELATDSRAIERLKQEILLASRVSHRNVLRIHDLGEAAGLRFISMAWVEGSDLAHLIQSNGPMREERLIAIGRQICEGLEAAHREAIVHRDLKPQNVLVDRQDKVCIADFGLAETAAAALAASRTIHLAGTPRYMSPEQVEGKRIDHRTDIYSMGLILYEMATGLPTFPGDSVFHAMMQRLAEPPKNPKLINPNLSDALAAVILRCLERDPELRYQTARQVFDALGAAALPAPVRRTNPKPVLAAAALLAAALGFVLFHFLHRAPEPPRSGKYIAVLPFRALGADPDLKYEAEGVADALNSRLFSLHGVHPVSQFALERVNLAAPEDDIARQVGANLVVRGAVQQSTDRVNIIVTVDNVRTHKTVWTKSFSGVRGDLLTIEDEIGNQLVAALDVTPTQEERARSAVIPTQNLVAYDLYLKGRDILKNQRNATAAAHALDLFQQACASDPGFALAWTGVSDASLLMYKLQRESFWAEKALTAAEEARSRNPNLPEVHFALGSVYTATGRNAQAIDELKQALALAPNSDVGYIRLGHAYLAQGQSELALAALRKAVEINPYYWYNHKQLGVAYFELGRNRDALEEFKRQVQLEPNDASGYNNIGAIYEQERRWKEAIPQFQKAISLSPSYEEYSNLGTAYYELGRYADAVTADEKAVRMNPNQATAFRNLADAYDRIGKHAEAGNAFNRSIQLAFRDLQVNPRDTGALQNLALSYAETGDLPKALQFIDQARSIDASNKDLMFSQAIIEAKSHHMQRALASLEQALQNGYSLEDAQADPDLKAVCAMPQFAAFAAKVR